MEKDTWCEGRGDKRQLNIFVCKDVDISAFGVFFLV